MDRGKEKGMAGVFHSANMPQKRQLPKLIACMTKNSLENMRNKALYSIDSLDMRGIRRRKLPLCECLILELKESGYAESAYYLQDLLYDNAQLVAEDDIGIVVDLRKRDDYLENIATKLQMAERERERENIKKECEIILSLALYYKEKGKGILWLAEKFFLASIAVGSRYLLDGGRLKCVCKYHYAVFLMDKFPGADTEEPFKILSEVRDACIGRTWPLVEVEGSAEFPPKPVPREDLLSTAVTIQLNRVLLKKSKEVRKENPAKGERLARLAERRAVDAQVLPLVAEAIIEVGICQLIMNNLNNARNTLERALNLNTQINNIEGICNVKMHQAAVMQRMRQHELAAQLLTEMGALAMEYGLRRLLGRALHLLGELHVRNERPELGTQHLIEAFCCFMGVIITENYSNPDTSGNPSMLALIHVKEKGEVFVEEAEQSRLMTAISSGQEKMASYFDLIRGSNKCAVDRVKCIEWKLNKMTWWDHRLHHDVVPCMCPIHNRTPLDAVKLQIQQRMQEMVEAEEREHFAIKSLVNKKEGSVNDFRELITVDDVTREKEVEQETTEEEKKETAENAAETTAKDEKKNLTFES